MKKGSQTVDDARILAAIASKTKVETRGANLSSVLPVVPLTKRWLFARMQDLETRGLIERVPETNGEFVLTTNGYRALKGEHERVIAK